jgi:hypothetical protein
MISIPSIRAGLPFENSLSLFLNVGAGGAIDPDVLAYISALNSAGTTVTNSQQTAIETFITAEKAANRWDKIKRFYLPVWGSANANAICMKSLTSGTFTGGTVNHAAGYINSYPFTGGYMDTNTTLNNIGITKNTYNFTVLNKAIDYGGDNRPASSFGTRDVKPVYNDANFYYYLGNLNLGSTGASLNSGICSMNGNTTTRVCKNRSNVAGVELIGLQEGTITNDFFNENVWLLRANQGTFPSGGQVGAFSMGTEITDAEDTAYTANLKALWETCTGLVLP